MPQLSNRTVHIRVNTRIHLVSSVGGVRPVVYRACRGASVVHVRVEARVELVCGVGAVRAIVGRCAGHVHTLTVGVGGRDTRSVASTVVAVLNLVGALGSDVLVLLDAQTVPRSLVYAGIEGSTDRLARSLDLSVCKADMTESNTYMNETDALLDRIAETAARVVGRSASHVVYRKELVVCWGVVKE